MSRGNKYAPDINLEDVSTYVREHRRSTGYDCVIVLHLGDGPGGGDWAEARLLPPGGSLTAGSEVVARGPVPTKQIARQMSALLHLVAQAYDQLEAFPWLWTPERRRAARGEDG